MRTFARALTVLVAALWLASPTVGSFGGENAGGTGVWILPAPGYVGGPPPVAGATGSATRQWEGFDSDLTLRADSTIGSMIATAIDPVSGLMIPLPVSGRDITVRGEVMRSFRDANVTNVQIVIVNAHEFGYRIGVSMSGSAEGGTLTIY